MKGVAAINHFYWLASPTPKLERYYCDSCCHEPCIWGSLSWAIQCYFLAAFLPVFSSQSLCLWYLLLFLMLSWHLCSLADIAIQFSLLRAAIEGQCCEIDVAMYRSPGFVGSLLLERSHCHKTIAAVIILCVPLELQQVFHADSC